MKKSIKRIAIILMSFAVIFSFTACKKTSPSEVVEKDLKGLQSESVKEVEVPYVNKDNADSKELEDKYLKWINMIQKFDYKIQDEKISKDGKTATVRVKISTYDFGNTYKEVAQEIKEGIDEGKINKDTDIDSYVIDQFLTKALQLKDKKYTKEVIINCKNANKNWEDDIYNNEDFQDAILGGMLTEAPNLTSILQ